MKKIYDDQETQWPSAGQVEQAREELRKALMQEELECALRDEAVNRLMTDLKVDRKSFRALWIQPLMTAGATLDIALVSIAQSLFRPN